MIARVLAILVLAAGPALSHELPGSHAHPHGDWSGTLVLLLAAGVLWTLFLLRPRFASRSKDETRDPR